MSKFEVKKDLGQALRRKERIPIVRSSIASENSTNEKKRRKKGDLFQLVAERKKEFVKGNRTLHMIEENYSVSSSEFEEDYQSVVSINIDSISEFEEDDKSDVSIDLGTLDLNQINLNPPSRIKIRKDFSVSERPTFSSYIQNSNNMVNS